jgi:orc1/cdc6 family replication initiation protein
MIIKNAEVLAEEFIPGRILHRNGQMQALRDNLLPLTENSTARNSFLFGPPGTGKTVLSRFAVSELRKEAPVLYSYANCWSYSSRYNIIYKILEDFGERLKIHRSGTPTDELLGLLKKKAAGRPAVVILDEADQMADDKVFYDLASVPNICMVFIANSEGIFSGLDERVRSRLASTERIEFPRYRTQEIFEILQDRAEYALMVNTIGKSQLIKIAEFSGGDARMGINMLKTVAEEAEHNDLEKITDELIEKSLEKSIVSAKKTEKIQQLNEYQKIIIEIIKSKKQIPAGELFSEFQKEIISKNLEPTAERTFRKYMEVLGRLKLVNASGEGRWRMYSA